MSSKYAPTKNAGEYSADPREIIARSPLSTRGHTTMVSSRSSSSSSLSRSRSCSFCRFLLLVHRLILQVVSVFSESVVWELEGLPLDVVVPVGVTDADCPEWVL